MRLPLWLVSRRFQFISWLVDRLDRWLIDEEDRWVEEDRRNDS